MRSIQTSSELLNLGLEIAQFRNRIREEDKGYSAYEWANTARGLVHLIPSEINMSGDAANLFILYLKARPSWVGRLFAVFGMSFSAAIGNFYGAATSAGKLVHSFVEGYKLDNANDISKVLSEIYECYNGKAYSRNLRVELIRGVPDGMDSGNYGSHRHMGGIIKVID